MPFPSEAELKKIRKKMEKVEGTLGPPENPTPLEKLRWDLCQKFVKYKHRNNLTQKEVARILSIDEAKVSKILHHRIDEFSTDRLIDLYTKLDPELKLKIS